MRNIFDQYQQHENRLTHALSCCLSEDPNLLKQFLSWVTGKKLIMLPKRLEILEQQVPGERDELPEEEVEKRGIPDMWIHDSAKWCLLIESKVDAPVSNGQLERHYKTAIRCGFEDIQIIVIAIVLIWSFQIFLILQHWMRSSKTSI